MLGSFGKRAIKAIQLLGGLTNKSGNRRQEMNIKVGNFTLRSDPYNLWITETIKSKDGKEYEAKVAGYSPTFQGLLNSFIKKKYASQMQNLLMSYMRILKS